MYNMHDFNLKMVVTFLLADEFDYAMGQTLSKVVPAWDTDLNFRLQQLDSVLASAASCSSSKSANSTTSEEDEEDDLIQGNNNVAAKAAAKEKRYACQSCDARFYSCGARNSHRRKVHERFHLCHDCDLAFSSAQKLERHLKTHSGIKEFKCETCGKEFMIERNLVRI